MTKLRDAVPPLPNDVAAHAAAYYSAKFKLTRYRRSMTTRESDPKLAQLEWRERQALRALEDSCTRQIALELHTTP